MTTDTEALIERAAQMCEWYAEFIRENVMSADIERHPYLPELEGVAEDLRALLAQRTETAAPVAEPIKLSVIRKWPEGFEARLQHVWLDVVSFIPNVKLWDLQRVLAEFGFSMEVYEGAAQPSSPAPTGEALSEEQILAWWKSDNGLEDCNLCKLADFRAAVRAVEKKHGIKEKP